MTLADTTNHVLWAFDYDVANATPANRRVLRRWDPAVGRPDGACVDAEGNIYVAIMAGNLRAAKQSGQLLDWVDPEIVARHMHAQYMACFLGWGLGEIDGPSFRTAALSGICLLLMGVTTGAFHAEVEARLKKLHREIAVHEPKEAKHAAKSRR